MEMVDSNKTKLQPVQIMEIAIKNTKVDRPMKQAKDMLTIEFNMPGTWKMQQGNTIFVCHKSKQPGYGYFRALNADTPRNYIENSKVFMKAAYKVGFDVLVTQFTDPTILNIFKAIGRNKPEDMGYAVQRTSNNGYQVTLVLGKARGGK